jgi:hypothetical protein
MSWWMHIDISCSINIDTSRSININISRSINIDSLTAIDVSRSITIYIHIDRSRSISKYINILISKYLDRLMSIYFYRLVSIYIYRSEHRYVNRLILWRYWLTVRFHCARTLHRPCHQTCYWTWSLFPVQKHVRGPSSVNSIGMVGLANSLDLINCACASFVRQTLLLTSWFSLVTATAFLKVSIFLLWCGQRM